MAAKKRSSLEESVNDEVFGDDEDEGSSEHEQDEGEDPIEDGEVIEAEPRESRKERRRQRMVDHTANEVERRIQSTLESRLGSLEQLIRQNQGVGYQQRQDGPPPQSPHLEQLERSLAEVYSQQDDLTAAWSAKMQSGQATQEEIAGFTKKARSLQERREELVATRTALKLGLGQHRQQSPQEVQAEIIRQQTLTRHGDVINHQRGQAMVGWADGYYRQRLAEGAQDSQELQDEAFDAARAKFGMEQRYRKGPPAPTRQTKARYGGTSSASGSGGAKKTVEVTKAMRDMAAKAFPHIKDERKRIEHFVELSSKKGD